MWYASYVERCQHLHFCIFAKELCKSIEAKLQRWIIAKIYEWNQNSDANCKSHAKGHVLKQTNETKQKQKIVTQNYKQQQELWWVPTNAPSGKPASCTLTTDDECMSKPCCQGCGTRERSGNIELHNRLPGEKHSLYDCEILQQQVAFGFRREARNTLADAELNGSHKFRGGFLCV